MIDVDGEGLAPYGWSDDVAARLVAAAEAKPQPPTRARAGRVVRVERGHAVVATGGDQPLVPAPPDASPQGPPVVGDWVALTPGEERPDTDEEVGVIAERTSALVRNDPDETHRAQVLVSNVDVVGLVFGLDRPFKPGKLERYLAAAWDSGARPLVIITKADVVDAGGAASVTKLVEELAIDVDVVVTSSQTGDGVDALADEIASAGTGVLLGESGAGKSTLVNRLVGQEILDTGDVRAGDAKGRHTTTSRHLVPLPTGGVLIDTPGVRAFALWDAAEGIDATYPEIAEAAENCRFRDCAHGAEPGCAIKAGLEAGTIAPDRYERYRILQHEQAEHRARAEQRRKR